MLIVNQNRTKIIENLNLGIRYDNPNYVIYNIVTKEDLGDYKTEENAKEVLREIIDMYKFNTCEGITQKNAVYKMPSKNGCSFVDGE